jgi:type VI secretion system protein ImpJ
MTQKPIWTEGLFITQHHLQQQDAYHEACLQERFRSVLPYSWGVSELEVDERALAAGEVCIRTLRAFMSDGTPILSGDADQNTVVPPRAVGQEFGPQMESLSVSLGVPHAKVGRPMTLMDGSSVQAVRFRREDRIVTDLNTATEEHSVPTGVPAVRLLFGKEPTDGLAVLPLLEIVRAGNGTYLMRDTFVPPVVRVGASAFLVAGFRRVLTAMTTRQRTLSQGRRMRSESAVEFQSSDVAKFWLLNVLSESIPVMSHISDSATIHPEQAYLELGRLIGKLTTFSGTAELDLPAFNYLCLGDVFEPMFARAVSLVNAVIAERYTQIPLERREDGMHLGKVDDVRVLRQELFLGVGGNVPEADIRSRIPRLVKIASWGQVGTILNSAVNGARLELEFRPPGALPVRPGITFFRMQKTPEFWPDVLATATIAIYHPAVPGESVELSLYAVEQSDL